MIARMNAEVARRLAKCAAYFAKELKVVLSVPAPRRVSRTTGRPYATVRAIPGAPPRKLTGRGRASIAWVLAPDKRSSAVGTNVIYMRRWEYDGHPYVAPTLRRVRTKLLEILRGQA
jgi:hypothetical protein